jgi:hypothetical protein
LPTSAGHPRSTVASSTSRTALTLAALDVKNAHALSSCSVAESPRSGPRRSSAGSAPREGLR